MLRAGGVIVDNKAIQHHVRRVAIDVLQAGNYLEASRTEKAVANLTRNVKHLREIVKEIKKSKR